MQSFSLASRQMLQREPKSHLLFRAIESCVNFAAGGFAFADLLGAYGRSQLAQQVPAILAGRGLTNHRKQPGLQTRLAAESRFAFKDLQIDRLQNFFGFPAVAGAATQGPAETGSMVLLEFSFKFCNVHSVCAHGFAVFSVLVT